MAEPFNALAAIGRMRRTLASWSEEDYLLAGELARWIINLQDEHYRQGTELANAENRLAELAIEVEKLKNPGARKALPRDVILARDGYKCAYCCATVTVAGAHIDHVMPRSRGGGDEPGNLVAACADCNLSKGAKTPQEWNPRVDESWLREHFLWCSNERAAAPAAVAAEAN
jgi:5-methylcytosine-specific restriction endonuclease McrA